MSGVRVYDTPFWQEPESNSLAKLSIVSHLLARIDEVMLISHQLIDTPHQPGGSSI